MTAHMLARALLSLAVAVPAPDLVRIHVADDDTLTDAVPQIEKQIRLRGALRMVDDPAEADVRVLVLSSGVIGAAALPWSTTTARPSS